jgi:hypothetical protein
MSETPNLLHQNQNSLIQSLPETTTFTVGRGDYLGQGQTAKATHGHDFFSDTQPRVEILDPNSGELKTAMVGVHKAIQMKLKGRQEPLIHN